MGMFGGPRELDKDSIHAIGACAAHQTENAHGSGFWQLLEIVG
jgi:hypothetical protein